MSAPTLVKGFTFTAAAKTVTAARLHSLVDDASVTLSATDKLVGRASAGSGAWEEIACTSFARTLLDDTDAASVLATLGLPATQANLAALAALSLVADRLPYANGTGTLALATFTAAGRAMVGAADAAAQAALLSAATFARCTSQLDSTSASFADITGLTLNVTAGVTYHLESHLGFTCPSSPDGSGGKFKLTGTATIGSLKGVYSAQFQSQLMISGPVSGSLPLTYTLAAYVNAGAYVCDLIFTPSGDGTVKWQFAQNIAGGGTSSVYEGAWMRLSVVA